MSARLALVVVALAGCRGAAAERTPARATESDGLCVTRGAIARGAAGGLRIDQPTVRAVVPGSTGDGAELRFTYRGPSQDSARLASGQLRRQLGLKLRAADGCNLIYAMWRIEPEPGIEVSVKRNPGQSRHAECGTRGYARVAPTERAVVPTLVPGARHALSAALTGDELVVRVDGQAVWRGVLGAGVAGLAGPAGLRTDNVALDLELDTVLGEGPPPTCPVAASD